MRRKLLLASGNKAESAFWPFEDSSEAIFQISTRGGDMKIKWGDNTESLYTAYKGWDFTSSPPSYLNHPYSPNFTGDVEMVVRKGLKDVYSVGIFIPSSGGKGGRFNITNFGEFINQFPNLYSIRITFYKYQNTDQQPIISGQLAEIPKSVKRYLINTFDSRGSRATLNLSQFPQDSELEEIWQDDNVGTSGHIQISGDLADLPANVKKFGFGRNWHNLSAVRYTGGRVWRSDIDSIELNATNTLTQQEADDLLVDLAASVTSAVGDKKITLAGSLTSKYTEIQYLESLGFAVTVGTVLNIQNDLHHHLKTKTADPLKDEIIVAGASWGLINTTNDISYPLGGGIHNADKGAVELSTGTLGSLCDSQGDIPFSIVMRINADALPSPNPGQIIMKDAGGSQREFQFSMRQNGAIRFTRGSQGELTNTYAFETTTQLSANTEYHIAITCAGGKPLKIYIDGVEDTLTDLSVGTSYTSMIPTNAKLKLFALFVANYEFEGLIKDVRIYRYRVLTQNEILTLRDGDEDTVV